MQTLFPCHWDKELCKLSKYSGFVGFNLWEKQTRREENKTPTQNTAKLYIALQFKKKASTDMCYSLLIHRIPQY